jgi:DNA polymerase III delta subunit
VQRAGANQMALSHELDKLLIYDPKITQFTIDLLIEPLPQSTVFDLLEAAFSGNTKRAIEIYSEQRKQQVEPQAIMGMIAWQVHILACVKASQKNGPSRIAQAYKINPYVVNKSLNLTSKMTYQAMKDLVQNTLDLDVRLKSESIDADDAVQAYLLTL